MKTMRRDVTRRAVGGVVAGLALAFGVVAGVSAEASVDANGIPVASSGDATVSIVGGEAVILFGEDAADELAVLTDSAVANETSLDDSSGLSVADASGGEFNIGVNDR